MDRVNLGVLKDVEEGNIKAYSYFVLGDILANLDYSFAAPLTNVFRT
jgi:hypothetical protein